MIQQAGLKMPPADGNWKVEDFITLAKGLTKSEGGRTTVYGVLPCIGNEGIVAWLRAYGGDLFDAEGKKCLLNTPEAKQAMRQLASLYTEHKAAQPWAANLNAQELFQGGKVGIAILTSFAAAAWPDQIAKLPNKFEMEVFPNPLGPTGKHASQVSSDGKGVSATTKNPDKAWRVLSRLFTSQPHGLNRFLRGLGSPGSRFDVWDSPEFKQRAPKLQNIAKVLVLPPAPEMAPWHHPANGRYFEHEPILTNEFVKVTLGQITSDQYCEDVAKQIQAIMDKPNV
jgi:ABC-type glycerol-3-phosphate transport system substrate-binding protein